MHCHRIAVLFFLGTLGLQPFSAAQQDQSTAATARSIAQDRYGDNIPYGATLRLGSERYRMFNQWDKGIFFCNDNQTIVTVGESARITWWEAETGKLIERQILSDHPGSFTQSADGTHLIVKSYRFVEPLRTSQTVIEFWNLQTRQCAKTVAWESDGRSAAWIEGLPESRYITANQNRIQIRDRHDETVTRELVLPGESEIMSFAVSGDGRTIAVSGRKVVWLLDIEAGEIIRTIEEIERPLAVELSPDNSLLAISMNTTRDGESGVMIWDIEAQEFTHQFNDPEFPGMYVREMVFSPDSKLLYAPNSELNNEHRNNAVLVWDLDRGELKHRLQASPGTRSRCVAVSPNGELVAAVGDSEISVWEVTTGNRIGPQIGSHTQSVTGVRFTSDDRYVVTTSDDATVRTWDAETSELLHVSEHERMIRGMSVSPDGRWCASSSNDDTVRLWDISTGAEVYKLKGHGHQGGRRAVGFTTDSSRFACWGDDMYLRVWDVRTGKALIEEKLKPGGFDFDPTARGIGMSFSTEGCFSHDALKLVLSMRAQLYVYDGLTGEEITNLSFGEQIRNFRFGADESNLLLVRPAEAHKEFELADGRVRMQGPKIHALSLFDLDSETDLWSFELTGYPGPMALCPQRQIVAASYRSAQGGEIILIDATNGEELVRIAKGCGLSYASNGQRMTFSNDGSRLAAAMHNGTVLVWDLDSLGIKRE